MLEHETQPLLCDGKFIEELVDAVRRIVAYQISAFDEFILIKEAVRDEFCGNLLRFIQLTLPQSWGFDRQLQKKTKKNRHAFRLQSQVEAEYQLELIESSKASSSYQTLSREFYKAFLCPFTRLMYRLHHYLLHQGFKEVSLSALATASHAFVENYYKENLSDYEQVIIIGAGYDSKGLQSRELRRLKTSTKGSSTTMLTHDYWRRQSDCSSIEEKILMNVIEIDYPEIHDSKAQLLFNHFSNEDILEFGEGIKYISCDLDNPHEIKLAISDRYINPQLKTLIIAENILSYLSIESVKSIFASLFHLSHTYQLSKENETFAAAAGVSTILHSNLMQTEGTQNPIFFENPRRKWTFVFDYFTDTFVTGKVSSYYRLFRNHRRYIQTGFPCVNHAEQIKSFLRSYGIHAYRHIDVSDLTQNNHPATLRQRSTDSIMNLIVCEFD